MLGIRLRSYGREKEIGGERGETEKYKKEEGGRERQRLASSEEWTHTHKHTEGGGARLEISLPWWEGGDWEGGVCLLKEQNTQVTEEAKRFTTRYVHFLTLVSVAFFDS